MPDAKIIVPGDPFRSLVVYRMSKLGYARMPYIGSRLVDSQGVALVARWIASLADDAGAVSGNPSSRTAATSVATPEVERSGMRLWRQLHHGQPSAERFLAALPAWLDHTETSLVLALYLHENQLEPAQQQALLAHARQLPNANIGGLFETFIPERARRQRLGPHVDPDSVLALEGDAGRGRLIYFSDAARCRNCHELTDGQKSLGPTLSQINAKYRTPADVLLHVLEPSKEVAPHYTHYLVATRDGRTLEGLVLGLGPENGVGSVPDRDVREFQLPLRHALQLKLADGTVRTLEPESVQAMRPSSTSLMPLYLLSDLTATEAADLLAFVRSIPPSASPADVAETEETETEE